MMEQKYCQSCAMPMEDAALRGTEKDGGISEDYCTYCYQNGAFTSDVTMEEMVEQCVPHMVSEEMSEAQARTMMQTYLPGLKRWQQ